MSNKPIRAILLGFALVAGGCTTSNLADVAPTAAVAPVPPPPQSPSDVAAVAPVATPDETGPRDTGTFPNLNEKPPAADQLAESEKDARIAELKAAKAGQGNRSGASSAELARLKKLARTHGKEALDEIEN